MKPLVLLSFLCLGLLQAEAQKPSKKGALPPSPTAGVKTPGIQIPFANLKTEAEIALAAAPSAMFFADMAFLPNAAENAIARLDTKTNKLNDPWPGAKAPCGGLVSAFKAYWVPACGDKTLLRLDPKSGKPTATLPFPVGSSNPALAANPDSLWLLSDDKTTLSRLDPDQNAIVAELRLPAACNSLLFADSSLWVTCPTSNRLLRIDPKTNLVTQRIEIAGGPIAQVFAEGAVWVLSQAEGKLLRVDPKTNKIAATVELLIPKAAGSLVFGEGSLWVSAPGFPLTRINPAAEKEAVVQQFFGEGHGTLYAGASALWLYDSNKKLLKRFDPKRIAATLAD